MASQGQLAPEFYVAYIPGVWTFPKRPAFVYRNAAIAKKHWGNPAIRRELSLWKCKALNVRPVGEILRFSALAHGSLIEQYWRGELKSDLTAPARDSWIADGILLVEEIKPIVEVERGQEETGASDNDRDGPDTNGSKEDAREQSLVTAAGQ